MNFIIFQDIFWLSPSSGFLDPLLLTSELNDTSAGLVVRVNLGSGLVNAGTDLSGNASVGGGQLVQGVGEGLTNIL